MSTRVNSIVERRTGAALQVANGRFEEVSRPTLPRSQGIGTRVANCSRSIVRLSALGWVMLTAALAFMLRRSHRCDLAARARWLQHTCRRALRVLRIEPLRRDDACAVPLWGVRRAASSEDCPYTPEARALTGVVVAANHLGYLDVLVLAAAAPAVFVAKSEVARWPVFGWFARAAGTRFVDRGKRSDVARVGAEFAEAIAAGTNVILFLEGTSTNGNDVLPFKASLLEPATRNGWATVPAAIDYRVSEGRSAADEVCWWGEMTLMPHLWNLASIPRIEARVSWGDGRRGTDRKRLAAELRTACVEMRRRGIFR